MKEGPVDSRHFTRIDAPELFSLAHYLRELTAGTLLMPELESEVHCT